ncbi:MAG: hypothetical protein F6K40_08815 [Okeania sp. SIO3I5]|nr:hypothetical protein [Okeania sp. SIO3I5]NEQ36370.1 hypothetical protein [Okeania sp. SIO3I5]
MSLERGSKLTRIAHTDYGTDTRIMTRIAHTDYGTDTRIMARIHGL